MGRQRPAFTRIDMNIRRRLPIASVFAVMIGLSILPGCGSGPPKPADPVAAREALDRTLTAWKDGKTPESLKSDEPPIVVSDHAWSNGARLIKYQIEPGDRRAGADHSFQVMLWLDESKVDTKPKNKGKDKSKGKDGEEKAEYYVGTNPILTVVRPF
jgi:hypothetical protein